MTTVLIALSTPRSTAIHGWSSVLLTKHAGNITIIDCHNIIQGINVVHSMKKTVFCTFCITSEESLPHTLSCASSVKCDTLCEKQPLARGEKGCFWQKGSQILEIEFYFKVRVYINTQGYMLDLTLC